jgi:hypothetical protein
MLLLSAVWPLLAQADQDILFSLNAYSQCLREAAGTSPLTQEVVDAALQACLSEREAYVAMFPEDQRASVEEQLLRAQASIEKSIETQGD